MTNFLRGLMLCTALTALAPLTLAPLAVQAHDGVDHGAAAAEVTLGSLTISGAYARATLPRAPVGGAFFTVRNAGAEDRLLSVTAPVGNDVQIHEMAMADGVMTMRQLSGGLVVPAEGSVSLEPGGYHLMIMGLTAPLVEGEALEMVLTFEKAGAVTVPFEIRKINAKPGDAAAGGDCEHGAEAGHDHNAEAAHSHDAHSGHGTTEGN